MAKAPPTPTVIAIDGPAGGGKSTVARELAAALGPDWAYLDTGAMYRAVTVVALEQGVPLGDGKALAALARAMAIDLSRDGTVRVNGRDVSEAIRTERVNAAVSRVAERPEVRAVMVKHQRRFAERFGRVVADGRDMATVVFPKAVVKVFLTASLEERARRRSEEMRAADPRVTISDVRSSIEKRDREDEGRAAGRLYQHEDAVRIDTTGMTPAEVLDAVKALVVSRVPPVAGR